MNFKVGDIVAVLDDNIFGTVIKVTGNTVTVESSDGFEFEFEAHELILSKDQNFSSAIFNDYSINEILKEKEASKKRKVPKLRPKERILPAMEVDLHIHHLTDSTRQMNNFEMLNLQLDTAKRQLEFAIKKRIQKVVFIHGVGEGVLRAELETLFGRYDNVKYYEADYKKYGLGATEVYIYQNTNP
ncbi:Smr domain-containing protein [Flavobacteriaceae bacterium MAR_2010_105]|nr:Smr domain-containing protein [Flavobacteriaceae bacterium MAR_2010_105]